MAIDIAAISSEARAHYIEVGKRYSSEDTLAQADTTLDALTKHGPALAEHGFAPVDQAKLAGARDGLLATGVERKGAQAGASQHRKETGAALVAGKAARESARSVLLGARRDLVESTSPAAITATQSLDAALAQTSRSGGSHNALVNQLSLLQQTLSNAAIAAAAIDRGGPAALAKLASAIPLVSSAPSAVKRGTPEETERLDLFDGIVVELSRAARRAARAAAKKAGSPALAQAFSLAHIDGHGTAAAPTLPAPAVATPGAPA